MTTTDQPPEVDTPRATAQELEAALNLLPPAGDLRGVPGHDEALDTMRGLALVRDKALGLTYDQMAARHGYRQGSGARQALLRALDRHEAADVRHLRAIENARYELDQRALRTIIADPTAEPALRIRAIDARTRSAARHARLNGLDAPIQVAVSSGAQAQLADALAELEQVVTEVIGGDVLAVSDEPLPDSD